MTHKPIRLQRFLAMAGCASRRAAEEMIRDGRVTINGKTAELGASVHPGDIVTLDGEQISVKNQANRILLLNKPKGVICSKKDPEGREDVFSLLPPGNWIMVGRLDYQTEGLLVFCEDGVQAHELMHPSHNLDRVYKVRAYGQLPDLAVLKKGVQIPAGVVQAKEVEVVSSTGRQHWLRIVLTEGKNREIREMLKTQGLTVSRLIRTEYGPYKLGNIQAGRWSIVN